MVENWQEVLNSSHIPCFVSPLHDKDVDSDGQPKKPHYHILLMYEGPKTLEQAQKVYDSIGAIKGQMVNSLRGEARYLCHLDNPEKYQYPIEDVLELNGADYRAVIELPSDRYGSIREMLAFIKENDVLSFSDFLEWASENNENWFRSLADSSAYIIKEHIKSRAYSLEHNLNADTSKWKVPSKEENDG